MRKKSLLFTFFISLVFTFSASAMWENMDTVPNDSLVITEFQFGDHSSFYWWGYFEVTNMSKRTMDLSQFFVQSTIQSQQWNPQPFEGNKFKVNLKGTLEPGESYLFVGLAGDPRTDPYDNLLNPMGYANEYMVAVADQLGFHIYQALDSVGSRIVNMGWRLGLHSRFLNPVSNLVDSARTDQFWFNGDYAPGNVDQNPFRGDHPIAGIPSDYPQRDYIWVRKPAIITGTTDFNSTRGSDLSDSQWLPMRRYGYGQWSPMYTTVKNHGDYSELELTSGHEGITINRDNMVITMPYGVRRDSVFSEFTWGPNTSYTLKLGADTSKHFIQADDSLFFYVYGNNLNEYKFSVNLEGSPTELAEVAPKYYKVDNPPVYSFTGFIRRYEVSQGYSPDTIGNVPFALRKDTLLEYLDYPETAVISFNYVDGIERRDLKDGDELVVALGETSKTYKISVDEYFPSDNADLQTVIFPGSQLFENPETFMFTDTLVTFNSNVTQYVLNLPPGTKVSPGIQAIPQNANANVYIQRAKNLNGTVEEQTANIIVTAEDGEEVKVYQFIFNVERERPPLVSEPFISDIANGIGFGSGSAMQIFNPNDDLLFLDEYMLFSIEGNSSWDAFKGTWAARDSNFDINNEKILRPGYYVMPDENGEPVFQLDYYQKTAALDPKGTYWMATDNGYPFVSAPSLYVDGLINPTALKLMSSVDLCTGKGWPYTQGAKDYYLTYLGVSEYPYLSQSPVGGKDFIYGNFRWTGHQGEVVGIMKILNDSILDGTKAIDKDFENDYEVVDILGGLSSVGTAPTFYQRGYFDFSDDGSWSAPFVPDVDTIVTIGPTEFEAYNMYRKSNVYKGNPIDLASLGIGNSEEGTVEIPSEWELYGFTVNPTGSDFWKRDWARPTGASRFKNHLMLTNVNIPYITSKLYVISDGMSENETIAGVSANTTLNQFFGNIILPDVNMSVVVTSGGVEKEGEDIIATGDVVTSTAVDGNNSVVYTIQQIGALDNNTTLTSATYTVSGSVVSGITFGTTIAEVAANVQAPETALMSIVTGENKDEIVPMSVYSNDTLPDGSSMMIDKLANERMFIEVLAQNGVDVTYYSLEFAASEPILYSELFQIRQDERVIDQLYFMSVATFNKLFFATPGADIVIVDVDGLERTEGIIRYDDRVKVVLNGVSKEYYFKFTEEIGGEGTAVDNITDVAFSIYPNPTTGRFLLSGVEDASRVQVMTLTGQIVKNMTINDGEMLIDLSSLNAGVYLIKVINNDETSITQKVVKQ